MVSDNVQRTRWSPFAFPLQPQLPHNRAPLAREGLTRVPAARCTSDALIDRKKMRFMGQNAKYAYIAMERAIEDSGLKPEQYQSQPRVGGILGQADTSAENIDEVCEATRTGKRIQNKIGPYRVTRTMSSSVSAVLSTQFKLQGTTYSIAAEAAAVWTR